VGASGKKIQLSISSQYEILRFSDLGHGQTKTQGTEEIYGYHIIERLSSATTENPTTLIGLSWGAMLCVDFALHYPDRVKKLILLSPGLNGWDYFHDSLALANNILRQKATLQNDIGEAAFLFHKNWVVGPRRKTTELEETFYRNSLDLITANMEGHWKEDWSLLDSIPAIENLENIDIPTFIIIGDQDAQDIKLIAEIYDEKVPHSEKIILENVAHLLSMEQPKVFNEVLLRILKL